LVQGGNVNARKSVYAVLLNVLLLAAMLISGCAPAATPTPTMVPPTAVPTMAPTKAPTAVPFDIKAVVVKYIASIPDGFGTIAPAALKDQMAATKLFLLDVREPKELTDNGFIAGAVNIPIRTLTQNLDKLPAKDQPIVVYCAIGHRGAMGMEALQLLGYTNVKSLAGGFNAWKAASMAVATGAAVAPVAGQKPEIDKDLFAAVDKYITSIPDGFGTIAPAALNDQLAAAKPFVLDVREAKEVTDNGYIASAVNVPIRTVFTDIAKLPQDKAAPIVVYCAIGHRGAMAMMALQLAGYTNVKSLSNGFNAWKAANLAITK
jgi:rhodanese-related sulfurtransferase